MPLKRINIMYVSPFAEIGGGEVSLLTILRNIDKERFGSLLVSYDDGPFIEKARAAGIETIVLRRTGVVSEFAIVRKLVRLIRERDIGIVHVNSLDIRAAIAARLAGVPCIGHLRVIMPFTWRDRLFVRLSAITIAVSRACVEAFSAASAYYRGKFIVLPNMVEVPAGARPAPLRHEYRIPEGSPLVGMAGRVEPYKGHEVFIDAAALIRKIVPNAVFFIVGAPSRKNKAEEAFLESLKKRVSEVGLGDSFVFTGFRYDILDVIAALDVLVVPSLIVKKLRAFDTEGFGRVAIEAMAVNVPVVSSAAGGLKELIEDGVTGLLVAPGDSVGTSKAVMRLLQDRALADNLRRVAKKKFDECYSVRSIDQLQRLYDDTARD